MNRSFQVRVAEVVEETTAAHSLVLDVPDEHRDAFTYQPGQHLTLRLPDAGPGVARSYSLSSSPVTGEPLKVTVKRVMDGVGSNWICDNITAGDQLETMPPAGTFVPDSLDDDLLLFAGGSGITPVISIVKTVLAAGAGSIVLVYANRDEANVIFRDELRDLVAAHPGRLQVVHWLESVQGLPTDAMLGALAAPFLDRQVFICGPTPFMDAVERALTGAGVPADRIEIERFVSLTEDPLATAPAASDATLVSTVRVELDGEHHELEWPDNRRLLDLLLDQGIDAPFSCREAQCSACACVLLEGEVAMDRNDILEPQDLDDGLILSCQARPLTDKVVVTYDG